MTTWSQQASGCSDILPLTAARETKGRRTIGFQHLMVSPQLRRAFIERFTPLLPGTDVDGNSVHRGDAIDSHECRTTC